MSTKVKLVKCKKFTKEKKVYGRQKIANHSWWSIKILEYSQWEDALQTVSSQVNKKKSDKVNTDHCSKMAAQILRHTLRDS